MFRQIKYVSAKCLSANPGVALCSLGTLGSGSTSYALASWLQWLNAVPSKDLQHPNPRACDCDLIWKESLRM